MPRTPLNRPLAPPKPRPAIPNALGMRVRLELHEQGRSIGWLLRQWGVSRSQFYQWCRGDRESKAMDERARRWLASTTSSSGD